MQMLQLIFAVVLVGGHAASVRSAATQDSNPIQKIIGLITEFQGKITRDGEIEEKAYSEYFEWCDDASNDKQNEIKTGTASVEKLTSTIEKAASDIEDASTRIEELSESTATAEEDLKAATTIRNKENTDFQAAEKELMESIDMLARAMSVLEKELKGSSFLQAKATANLKGALNVLKTVLDAASFSTQDRQKLLALVQRNQGEDTDQEMDDQELALGAPDPKAYESKSGSIVDMLADMKDEAETQLADARKAERDAKHNYDMLKLTLTDKLTAEKKEMDDTKANKAEAQETKATAEGEIEVAKKDLDLAEKDLHDIQMDCMEKAADHETTIKGRKEELAALAKAKKIIQAVALGQVSFIQLTASSASRAKTQSKITLAGNQVASLIKKLARNVHSMALAQLASRVEAAMRYHARTGEDPFAKIKGLIQDMISKLLKEAQEEAEEKAYCDEEMGKTKKKKEELTDDLEGLTTKIDDATSASTQLKEEVKTLQKELVELAKTQGEMDKARQDAHAAFLESSGDLKKGLDAVRKALQVLRDYYAKDDEDAALLQSDDGDAADSDSKFDALMQQPAAPAKHEKSGGAGSSIIGLLEVAESDFSKNLAQETEEEEAAQSEYETMTQDNKVTKAAKDQDVKYKTKEYKSLDKSVAELSSDRDALQTELDAVLEYYDKIKEKCVAKPEPYEERKKRREAEIAGLKEALSILEGEAVFLQQGSIVNRH